MRSALKRAREVWGVAYEVEASTPSVLDEWKAVQRASREHTEKRRRIANIVAAVVVAALVAVLLSLLEVG